MPATITETYLQHSTAAAQQITTYDKLINRYSLLRMLVFAAMGIAVCIGISINNITFILIGIVLLIFVFVALVSKQSGFMAQKQYFEAFKAVNDNELNSIDTQANLYDDGSQYQNEKHLYLSDLDIFGSASLFKLVNRSAMAAGRAKLAAWLTSPSAKADIEHRQQAVKELAGKTDWKLDTQAKLLFAAKQPESELARFLMYLKQPLPLKGEQWLGIYGKVALYMAISVMVLSFFFPVAKPVLTLLILFNLVITYVYQTATKQAYLITGKLAATLSNYAQAFDNIEKETWQAEYSRMLTSRLKTDAGLSVAAVIKQLAGLIQKLSVNDNMLIGFFANAIFIWNVRQVIAIESWKRNNQANLEAAFEVMAEFEALLSLSSLASNYPAWSFPAIAGGEAYTLTAHQVAHPLIPQGYRVANDYSLANTYHIDVITGSNMAGKSTFLRTLGINTVLALSGAPVCAQRMEVSVMQLITYMRIKDSLNESTSTFKAELDRLALLLKTVEQEGKVFFLIDEMLRGTNSVDKYLGSKAVIERLIARQGVGLVATHDLQLAELEQQYPHYVRNFYFDIQVIDGEMLFDYKLKHGECKTFNASLLLKQIGIEVG